MLRKDLAIHTFRDLLEHYPLRHIDKTNVSLIGHITPETDFIQVNGRLLHCEILGEKRTRRLTAQIQDSSGSMELTWFQGINWVEKLLHEGEYYLVYGKPGFFNGKLQMSHPEIESVKEAKADGKPFLEPIYPTTEKLKVRGLNARQIGKLTYALISQISVKDVPENLPESILGKMQLISRFQAFRQIHFPKSVHEYNDAVRRLKFEELFIAQVRLNIIRVHRNHHNHGT